MFFFNVLGLESSATSEYNPDCKPFLTENREHVENNT